MRKEVGDAIFLASSKMPTIFTTPDGAETLGVSILGINSVKGLVATVLEKGSSQIDADIRASSVNMHYTVVGKKRPIKITALTRWADLRVATSVPVMPRERHKDRQNLLHHAVVRVAEADENARQDPVLS